MTSSFRSLALAANLGMAGVAASVQAQVAPWVTFQDSASSSICDVIHAENAELVLSSETNQLILVSGSDRVLSDTLVDDEGNVLFEDTPVGVIDFALDGDGERSVWWMGLTGEVVQVDAFTGEPTPTDLRPNDFRGVACDACDFWDDPQICAEDPAPEPDPITIPICGQDITFPLAMMGFGLVLLRLAPAVTRRTKSAV